MSKQFRDNKAGKGQKKLCISKSIRNSKDIFGHNLNLMHKAEDLRHCSYFENRDIKKNICVGKETHRRIQCKK